MDDGGAFWKIGELKAVGRFEIICLIKASRGDRRPPDSNKDLFTFAKIRILVPYGVVHKYPT